MTDEQIKHMVDRFLCWKLPSNFSPDGGIGFKAGFTPSGTNLFDATQAEAMVRYMVEGLGALTKPESNPGTPISQLSGRPGDPGYDEFCRISESYGFD